MAEQTAAVPAQFNYSPIPPAVGGYVSQQKNMPSNGTVFGAGQTIEIPLVTGRVGQFIDPARSYLMFCVKMVSATRVGLMLERVGAHAFFEQFEIWLNGQPIEQIWAYNAIAQLMYDLYYGVGRSDLMNFVEGCAYTSPVGVSVAANGFFSAVTADATVLGNTAGRSEAIAIVSQGHFTGAGPMAAPQTTVVNSTVTNSGLAVRGHVDMTGCSVAVAQIVVDGNANANYATQEPGYTNFQIVPNTVITSTTKVDYTAGDGPQATFFATAASAVQRENGRYFAIPLISGLLGTLAMKMFPALTFAPGSLMLRFKTAQPAAVGCQVEIIPPSYNTRYRTGTVVGANVNSAGNCLASTGGFTFEPFSVANYWTLSDVTYVTTTVTLQAGVSASILSAAQSGTLDLHTKSFTDVYAQVPSESSAATLIIPLRKLSMNTLFVFFRDTARETGGTRGGGYLSRLAPVGACTETFSWYCIFGNERIREYPYLRPVETIVENLRALHEWTDLEINFGPALRPILLASGAMNDLWATSNSYSWVNPVGGFYGAICDNVTNLVTGTLTSAPNGAIYTCDKWSFILQNCGFFLSLDLDVYSGTTGTSRSGRNTTGDQITIYLDNGNANSLFPGVGRSVRADFVALHDLRINIQAGGIAVPVS